MPNPSIKNQKMYQELREQGNSEQKSARIANAVAARGGESGSYDDWSVAELKKRAKEIGLSGYSGLNKKQLVSKLRNSQPRPAVDCGTAILAVKQESRSRRSNP
jgi:hypothetical protein